MSQVLYFRTSSVVFAGQFAVRMLEVRLLGQFDVRRDGTPILIPSRPAQALFAYLILNAGTIYRREKLAGLLWPDTTDANARSYLRHELWRVRKAIETDTPGRRKYLIVDEISIGFDADAGYWLDASILEKASPKASASDLIKTLSLYRGELLPGFYDEWVVLERERLQAVFEQKMARLMDRLIEERRWGEAQEWGERWIALGQTPEPAYRALMAAHSASGDVSKVAAVYQRAVEALRTDLGVEPSEQTRALYERLVRGGRVADSFAAQAKESLPPPSPPTGAESRPPALDIALPSPVSTVPPPLTNLPVPLTSFVGREQEIAEVKRVLASRRLVTLTGAGGSGKTRLAIQVASDVVDEFQDGVWWVELAALADPTLVPQAVAKALGVREVPNQPLSETLTSHLRSKKILLVLDNCEHLVEACAQLAGHLLSACADLKILATSREALGLTGEHVWQVPTLTLPDARQLPLPQLLARYEGIQLFVERAMAVKPDFELTTRNAFAVAQVCRRLDGIPLAIELAAARVKVLTPQEIAVRLNDLFGLLTSGSRTALPRQQTLRATIDWSHNLLTEGERILFRRLSVFAGGVTLEGAQEVCAGGGVKQMQILDFLSHLVDKSLVMVDVPRQGVEDTRYRMLETIREYAREKLEEAGEAGQVRNRHLEYFVGLAEKAEANTFGAESVSYSKRLNQELDNIRVALDWSIQTRQAITAFRLAAAMSNFWPVGLNDIGYNGSSMGEWQGIMNKALSLPEGLKRSVGRAKALNASGFFYWAGMSPVNPHREIEEALSIGRELEDNSIIAKSLCNLGLIENVQGNYAEARALLQQGLDLLRESGPERKTDYVWALIFLGEVAFNQDDLQEAQMLYEQSSSMLREIHDRNFQCYLVRRLGQLAWHRGEFEKATELYKESLKLNLELGDERAVIACLSAFAGIALARGQAVHAAQVFGAVRALLNARSSRLLQIDRMEYERNVSTLRSQLDSATLEKAWAIGAEMTLEQAVEDALETSESSGL